jgi:hypothetical protein
MDCSLEIKGTTLVSTIRYGITSQRPESSSTTPRYIERFRLQNRLTDEIELSPL